MTPGPGIKPGPHVHWCEASALTTKGCHGLGSFSRGASFFALPNFPYVDLRGETLNYKMVALDDHHILESLSVLGFVFSNVSSFRDCLHFRWS